MLTEKDYERAAEIETDCRIRDKFEDSRFGDVFILEVGKSSKKIIMKEKVFHSKNDAGDEIQALKKRMTYQHENLLSLLDFSTKVVKGYCSSTFHIKIYFEYPDLDLDKELRRRSKSNIIGLNSFEMTHLLYQMVLAGAEIHAHDTIHGDINPRNIEMDNPEHFKLVECFGNLASLQGKSLERLKTGGDTFSAPEVYLKNVMAGNVGSRAGKEVDYQTADVFSLGMVLLRAGSENGLQAVYRQNGTIDGSRLEQLKERFSERFQGNNLLISTTFAMLCLDGNQRPNNFREVRSNLLPYDAVMNSIVVEKKKMENDQGHGAYEHYVNENQWEKDWVEDYNAPHVDMNYLGQSGREADSYYSNGNSHHHGINETPAFRTVQNNSFNSQHSNIYQSSQYDQTNLPPNMNPQIDQSAFNPLKSGLLKNRNTQQPNNKVFTNNQNHMDYYIPDTPMQQNRQSLSHSQYTSADLNSQPHLPYNSGTTYQANGQRY